jgi:hypothetical protein
MKKFLLSPTMIEIKSLREFTCGGHLWCIHKIKKEPYWYVSHFKNGCRFRAYEKNFTIDEVQRAAEYHINNRILILGSEKFNSIINNHPTINKE